MPGSLVYAVPADLGSGSAHCIHVVKMGAALRLLGLSVDICVISAPSEDKLSELFGTKNAFPVTRIDMSGAGPFSLRYAQGILAHTRKGTRILTRNLPTALITSLAARRTVLELHSPVTAWHQKLMFRLLLKLPSFIGFVTITEALKRRFIEDFGPTLEPIAHVLPDAADPVHPTRDAETSSPLVGYMGGFNPGKGADFVLKIAKLLPHVRFELIGGPEENLGDISHLPNVHLTGRLSHAEATDRVGNFDIALLPNQERVLVSGGTVDIGKWTSPLKLFEYMAACRPIIASRLSVLQEVLTDGQNGLLADPNSPEEWALQIKKLIDDQSLARRLADSGHKDFLMKYSWTSRARRMSEIFGFEIAK